MNRGRKGDQKGKREGMKGGWGWTEEGVEEGSTGVWHAVCFKIPAIPFN